MYFSTERGREREEKEDKGRRENVVARKRRRRRQICAVYEHILCNLLLRLQLTIAGLVDGGADFVTRKRAEHSHDEKVETDGEVIAEHDS